MSDDQHELLRIEEVAEMLKVPVASVRRWRYVGAGPAALKVGRHLRYRRDAVDRWLEQQERLDPSSRGGRHG